jgi:pimeloyl-ACP methyl ester carboxylesterase/DNA-binding CsgD family transcriptional regulator
MDGRRIAPPAAPAHDTATMSARQRLRFCTSADGTRIAVAAIGSGPPLVRAAHWLSHVEYDLESPVWRPWLAELSRDHSYIRYDQRGCGLSDRDVADLSLDAWVSDLEAVVDSLGLRRFPLLGMSQGGAVAIAYTARHPERVSHLVFAGAYARGTLRRELTEVQRLEADTLVNLIRVGWGRNHPSFRQVFPYRFIPRGTPEQLRWWGDLEQVTASADVAARTLQAFQRVDVSELARRIAVPTLVLHARGDVAVPFDEGRRLAAMIAGSRFVPLDSDNHVLLDSEAAWGVFLSEVRAFLRPSSAGQLDSVAVQGALTAAERDVLHLVADGLDNRAIAQRLHKSEKTVRNQVSAILDKLGVRTRAEAIVRARGERTDA